MFAFVTLVGIAASVSRAFSRICTSVYVFVCTLQKQLELSTPNWYTYTP